MMDLHDEQRACRVCLCTDEQPCLTELGPCFWVSEDMDLCSACAEATAHHQVKTWWPSSAVTRASCSCGWSIDIPDLSAPDIGDSRERVGGAIFAHWRNVLQAGNLNPKLTEDEFAELCLASMIGGRAA